MECENVNWLGHCFASWHCRGFVRFADPPANMVVGYFPCAFPKFFLHHFDDGHLYSKP